MSIQVIAVGMDVPRRYIFKECKSLFMILVPVMSLTYIISGVVIYLIGHENFLVCMVIGAAITPTDPVLASAILKGNFANKYIPKHLRNLLIVESGANDGLGFLLMAFPVLILRCNKNLTEFTKELFFTTIGYGIFFAILLGVLIGVVARKVLLFCKSRGYVDKESYLSYLLVLSFFSIGVTSFLQVDDILALFVVGLAFSWDDRLVHNIRESNLLEIVDLIFSMNFFIFFGTQLTKKELSLINIVIGVVVVTVKRLPFFFLFKKHIPQLFNNQETFFAGWFGPVGVGAIFFSYEAVHQLKDVGLRQTELDWIVEVTKAIVLCSVVIHGITVPIVHFLKNRNARKRAFEETVDESDYTDNDSDGFVSELDSGHNFTVLSEL